MLRYLTPAITLSMIALSAQTALAEKYNFRVYNNTGTSLDRLYMTQSGYGRWGYDILRQSVLPDGYSVGINFENPSSLICDYDIRAVFSTGEIIERYGVDVCRNDWYTIYRRSSPVSYY